MIPQLIVIFAATIPIADARVMLFMVGHYPQLLITAIRSSMLIVQSAVTSAVHDGGHGLGPLRCVVVGVVVVEVRDVDKVDMSTPASRSRSVGLTGPRL